MHKIKNNFNNIKIKINIINIFFNKINPTIKKGVYKM